MNVKDEQIQPFAGLQNLPFPYPQSFTQGYSHSTTLWLKGILSYTRNRNQGVFEGKYIWITDAIEEIDLGKGIPHEEVMANIRKKYMHKHIAKCDNLLPYG